MSVFVTGPPEPAWVPLLRELRALHESGDGTTRASIRAALQQLLDGFDQEGAAGQ